MAFNVYASTDSGAPTLPNANGSLNALLYACLVTGYGSKAGAGWTRPFTGTHLAAFLQGAGGHGCYLRVADNLTDSYGRRVQLRGYEAMSGISTGTGPFPTTGQVGSGGANMHYYYTTGGATAPAPWVVIATDSFVHVLINTEPTSGYWDYFSFGSIFSRKSGDAKPVVLIASVDSGSTPGGYGGQVALIQAMTGSMGVYVARSDTGASGALYGYIKTIGETTTFGGGNNTTHPYPDRPSGALLMSPAAIWVDGYERGRIPGLWATLHTPAAIGGTGTTWSGTAVGSLAGKEFSMVGPLSSFYAGTAFITLETSDTWN